MGRILASRRWRIFLIAWVVYSAHFATNVVREHYPAFALAEQGTFRVDRYQGFHPDIFVHTDGHSYIGNQVIVSVLAAVPLFLFDPVLDRLEARSKRALAASPVPPDTTYDTHYPNRRRFFQLVTEGGLELRFGAATAVTGVFFMAPFSALCVLLMYHVLLSRPATRERAAWLALLFAFGTPMFFRTAPLNHNMFVMYATFASFVLLWLRRDDSWATSTAVRAAAGLLAGFTLAADYMGVLLIPLLYVYFLIGRAAASTWGQAFRESLVFVAASVPPVLFLLYSQWAMFGNPFLPGQYWMPNQNIYVQEGWRGFDWPSLDLLYLNLFDSTYGMYTFGPLLALGLIPVRWYARDSLALPTPERRLVVATFVVLMLFCAANQYSRLQFNTGFRYLVPLVPLIYLQVSDHLARLPSKALAALTGAAVLYSWIPAAFREAPAVAWPLFLEEGVQLPWLRVMRMTSTGDASLLGGQTLPIALLATVVVSAVGIWWLGERLESVAPASTARTGHGSKSAVQRGLR